MSKQEEKYYKIASEASRNASHPAVLAIKNAAKSSKRILDLGCGEGTRLENLKTKGDKTGVDVSDFAIKKAKKKFSHVQFIKADIEKLPFKSNSFDLVYCMFVIEHTNNPEKVLRETVRVLEDGGTLILGAPNFGAPNRTSPNSKENKLLKLLKGFILLTPKNSLNWTKVTPAKGKYFIDADTQVEPYIGSLTAFLRNLGLRVVATSSLWKIDDFSLKQFPFRILGDLKIPPFVWWGPQIFVIAKK